MRVIQMACYTAFDYSIDGHQLEVIEADSILMQPYTVDSMRIFAGQRYSHILDTHGKQFVFIVVCCNFVSRLFTFLLL